MERSIELDSRNADAFNNLGQAYESQERPDDANAVYRQALQCVPGHDGALTNLGNVLAGKGEYLSKPSSATNAPWRSTKMIRKYTAILVTYFKNRAF